MIDAVETKCYDLDKDMDWIKQIILDEGSNVVISQNGKPRLVKNDEDIPLSEDGDGSPEGGDSPMLKLKIIHNERSNDEVSRRDLSPASG